MYCWKISAPRGIIKTDTTTNWCLYYTFALFFLLCLCKEWMKMEYTASNRRKSIKEKIAFFVQVA